jgi:hypothetical protein
MDVCTSSWTLKSGTRTDVAQQLVLDWVNHERLKLTEMKARLDLQLSHSPRETETLLLGDGQDGRVQCLAKGIMYHATLEKLGLRACSSSSSRARIMLRTSEGKEACGIICLIGKIMFVRQEVVHGLR